MGNRSPARRTRAFRSNAGSIDPAGLTQLTRSTRRASVARAWMDLPLFVLSVPIVAYIADMVGFVPWGCLVAAAWLASGPVVLVRRVEDAGVSGREGLRVPARMSGDTSARRGRS